MRRRLPAILSLSLLLAALVSTIRFQPEGKARVIRRGSSVRFLTGRLAFASPLPSARCFVSLERGTPFFREPFPVTGSDGDEFELEVSFAYEPVPVVPSGWAGGDWCSAVSSFARATVTRFAAGFPSQRLLDNPRPVADEAVIAVTSALGSSGVNASSIAVRPRIPEELERSRPVPEIVAASGAAPPVIVIGLDGADWNLLDEYIKRGSMPNLARLVAGGARGVLKSEHPPLSPLIWTTMMTGVGPLEHQILDFTRFNPSTGVKEPITSDERKVPAVWNMATQAGKRAAVIGLWSTWPAEPVRGMIVSDRLFTFLYRESTPPPGIVFPRSREASARGVLDRTEKSIELDRLKRYFSWLEKDEYAQLASAEDPYSHPITALRRILIETAVYDELAAGYLSEEEPDLLILYLQGTDSIGHVFAPYVPPRQAQVSELEYSRYSHVTELYFKEIDQLIGRYAEVVKQRNGVLIVASDHGFLWKEGRPTKLSSFAVATAAKWHRQDGIFLLWGNGITPSSGLKGSVRQLTPTLLSLMNIPSAAGQSLSPLPGTPRRERRAVDYRAHYKPAAPVTTATNASTDEEIAKLRALGYIGSAESVKAAPGSLDAGSTRTAGSYNNAGLILKDEKKEAESIASFEKAILIDPNLASALWNLSDILFAKGENERSDSLLVLAYSNGLPEGHEILIGRAIGYQRNGHADWSLRLLERAVESNPDDKELRMFRGRYRIDSGDCAGAMKDFNVAQQLDPRDPIVPASAGLAALCDGNESLAADYFRKSLQLDPNQPRLLKFLQQIR